MLIYGIIITLRKPTDLNLLLQSYLTDWSLLLCNVNEPNKEGRKRKAKGFKS